MLRLTVLLVAGMFLALLIAGQDRGQLRPGLANAVADAPADPAPVAAPPAEVAAEVAPVGAPKPAPAKAPEPVASATPEPAPEPARDVVQVMEDPVFTLSALPTERLQDAAAPDAPAADTAGQILYVTADSVNVREGPSTDASVVGKLGAGEAALVVADIDGQWARIVIQGDGMEGYVALRFLSSDAP
jgi:Bacterial SH3 domain